MKRPVFAILCAVTALAFASWFVDVAARFIDQHLELVAGVGAAGVVLFLIFGAFMVDALDDRRARSRKESPRLPRVDSLPSSGGPVHPSRFLAEPDDGPRVRPRDTRPDRSFRAHPSQRKGGNWR